jgi:hypothetical protein
MERSVGPIEAKSVPAAGGIQERFTFRRLANAWSVTPITAKTLGVVLCQISVSQPQFLWPITGPLLGTAVLQKL